MGENLPVARNAVLVSVDAKHFPAIGSHACSGGFQSLPKTKNKTKMKITRKIALLSVAGLSLVTMTAQAQLDSTFNANDVLLGFRASAGNGTTTQLVFNLGSAQSFRDATANSVNFANIGSILSSTYDSNWYDRTNLWAGFISATNGTNSDNSGDLGIGSGVGQTDPNSTIYVSRVRTSVGTVGNAQGSTPGNPIALDPQVAGLAIASFGGTFSTNQSGGQASLATATANGWATNVTASTAIDFGTFNIEGAFTSGNFTFGAAGTVERMWDFYRVPNFGETTGLGQFQGTFTINNSGQVSFVAVPEPSTYALLGLGAIVGFIAYRRRLQKTA